VHFSHRPAINRASKGDRLSCSAPTNFLVPIVTVEGFSILSRRAKLDTPSTLASSVMPTTYILALISGLIIDTIFMKLGRAPAIRSIGMNLHRMARLPSSRETVAMTLWSIDVWEKTRP
jgi:hypothetical protein